MAAPFLLALGALGAGTAVQTFGQDILDRRRGRRLGGILDDLPQDAGADEARAALATAGLLSPENFANIGFNDAESRRDFLEQLAQLNTQYDLADRNSARSFGRSRAAQLQDAQMGQGTASIEAANAVLGGFEQQAQAIGTEGQRIQNIVELASQLPPSSIQQGIAGIGDPATRAQYRQLEQAETEFFYDWLFQTYGDREPNPDTLAAFQNSFQTFTNGGGLFGNATGQNYNTAMEVYGSRYADVQQRLESLREDTRTQLQRVANPNQLITPREPNLDFSVPSIDPTTEVPGGAAEDQSISPTGGQNQGGRNRTQNTPTANDPTAEELLLRLQDLLGSTEYERNPRGTGGR